MLLALRALVGDEFQIVVVDVDADPALVVRYDELVPVLMGAVPGRPLEQLCNYYLIDNVVCNFLARSRCDSGISSPESGKIQD